MGWVTTQPEAQVRGQGAAGLDSAEASPVWPLVPSPCAHVPFRPSCAWRLSSSYEATLTGVDPTLGLLQLFPQIQPQRGRASPHELGGWGAGHRGRPPRRLSAFLLHLPAPHPPSLSLCGHQRCAPTQPGRCPRGQNREEVGPDRAGPRASPRTPPGAGAPFSPGQW